MARPRLKSAKHRRTYCVLVEDPDFHSRKFFVRDGYKSIILKECIVKFPFQRISIFVLSEVISNLE